MDRGDPELVAAAAVAARAEESYKDFLFKQERQKAGVKQR